MTHFMGWGSAFLMGASCAECNLVGGKWHGCRLVRLFLFSKFRDFSIVAIVDFVRFVLFLLLNGCIL